MNEFGIRREDVAAALEKTPALRPLLTRFARAAAKGKRLPETFTAKGLDYGAQRELDGFLHTVTGRTADGTVYGSLLPFWRAPAAWRDVVDLLLAEKERAPKPLSFFGKVRLHRERFEEVTRER